MLSHPLSCLVTLILRSCIKQSVLRGGNFDLCLISPRGAFMSAVVRPHHTAGPCAHLPPRHYQEPRQQCSKQEDENQTCSQTPHDSHRPAVPRYTSARVLTLTSPNRFIAVYQIKTWWNLMCPFLPNKTLLVLVFPRVASAVRLHDIDEYCHILAELVVWGQSLVVDSGHQFSRLIMLLWSCQNYINPTSHTNTATMWHGISVPYHH